MKHYQADILIVGAGCAGTSLAHHLARQGFGGRVILLDERTDWAREQRWCAWRVPTSMQHLVAHRWPQWQARNAQTIARQNGDGLFYQQISAPAFYDYFHALWRASARFDLFDGARVLSLSETASGIEARTARGVFRAPLAFDARHAGGGALHELDAPGHLHLRQSFVGWRIQTERPAFDERTATLMDFRWPSGAATEGAPGLGFAYVLPVSPTRALVESTHFGARALPARAHERALHHYIARYVEGGDYGIEAREAGELPMASAPLRQRAGRRVWRIGVASGAARPSSGYAFGRIQRQTRQLARHIVAGTLAEQTSERADFGPRKFAVLDEIFLQVLSGDAALARRCFLRMFERVPPAALVRFLSEESSALDDARLIAALPKLAFCRAALTRAQAHVGNPTRRALDASHARLTG